MIQIKKTILTLVSLLSLTTGAWATGEITVTWNPSDIVPEHLWDDSFTKDGITFTAATCDFQVLTFGGGGTFTTTLGNFTKIEISADYAGDVSGTGWSNDGWQSATWTGNAASVSFSGDIWGGGMTCDGGNLTIVFTIEESPAIKVAWNGETKTGSFTMPGGNVTLEPEYYPQAAVADGGVTAADADARATTDDPLVKVDATKLTGAKKLMYFVSNSGTTAPAYDAEGWTDQLPTAEGITQAGNVYVWYYPVGTDEGVDDATATYSDGDMNATALSVNIADAPTYAVTFAEGTDPNEWKAEPNAGVTKGTEVTVTYTGSKKVIGVKAEKKAKAPASTPLDNTTTAWSAGTYAVPAGGLTYSDAITVSGDVTLTLTDGETLTLNKGISLAEGATLTVEGNGTMNVNGTNGNSSSTVAGTGTLVLTSGTLNAKGGDGGNASSGYTSGGGNAINGAVTVSGGTLTATGGNGGSDNSVPWYDEDEEGWVGGSGYRGDGAWAISGDVIITAGIVTAKGGNGGSLPNGSDAYAGAGGNAINGNVTLSGGTLTKTDGNSGTKGADAAGYVGAGRKAVAGTVTNNGGTVN